MREQLDELARLQAAAKSEQTTIAICAYRRALLREGDYLLEYVRRLEGERDERVTMAARAQEALRYVMNGLPTNDAVWAAYGNADSARAWLAARDAQQRREGAATHLELMAELSKNDCMKNEYRAEAKRLREEGK